MATTLLDLIEEIAELFGHLHIGTAETGSTTSAIVDGTLIEPNDFWVHHYVYVTGTNGVPPEGEERYVSGFVQDTGTLTIAPPFSALIEEGDTYLVLPMRRNVILRAIGNAVQKASNHWGVPTIDTSTVAIAEGVYQYTLPGDLIWLEDVLYRSETGAPWHPIRRDSWSVAGTPGAQVLDLVSIAEFSAGDNLRLDYIKRLPALSADDDELAIGVPAEAELIDYLIHRALWYLHSQAANRGIAAGTFRENLTLAKNAGEEADRALEQAPSWQRAGRWHVPRRPSIRG